MNSGALWRNPGSMKILSRLAAFAFLALAPLAVACSDDDGDSKGGSSSTTFTAATSGADYCDKSCAYKAPIECPKSAKSATCVEDCKKSAAFIDACLSQFNASAKCQSALTASDLQCNADGEIEAKDSTKCKAEEDAINACLKGS